MFRHYFKIILFFIIFLIPIILKLKAADVRNIKIFRFKNWHHGFAYFTGIHKEKKVFIKFDTRFHLLYNDKQVYEICKPILSDYLVDIVSSSLVGKLQYIMYGFVENSVELNDQILSDNLNYIGEILYILKNISAKGIIHRDIKLDNFLVVNNKLKIIDFTFAISKNFKELDLSNSENCSILEFLGMGFNPKPFVWDDYYAMTQILTELKLKSNKDSKKKIEEWIFQSSSMIGRYKYSVRCNSKLYFYKRNFKIKIKDILKLSHNYRSITDV